MEQQQELKIIYSKRLAEYLLLNDECVFVKIIPHPYREGFKAWIFVDNEALKRCMMEFTSQIHKV